MESFRKLGLSEKNLEEIRKLGFEKPTEIQEKGIPLVIQGKDVVAQSATGSGKTLVFGLGIIQNIEKGNGVRSLILTPTRELAEQIYKALTPFAHKSGVNITAVYGGVSINPQIDAIRDSEIVVGTPGRILDHLERRTLTLEDVQTLVLDEADKMLDMGFFEDVLKIIHQCPIKRQTLLFSATFSQDILHLAKKYMKEPVHISAETYVDRSKLEQFYYDVRGDMKFSLLVHLLSNEKSDLVMVFCNTQRNTDFVAKNLRFQGINAIAIHGGHSQNKRTKTMETFSSNKTQILVCTDVASRGLDIKNVSHIYNYDIPKDADSYVHRIGRTARAGEEGIAVSLVTDRDYESFSKIVNNPDLQIKALKMSADVKRIMIRWAPSRDDRGRRGGRGGFGSSYSYGGRGGGNRGGGFRGRSRDSDRGDRRDSRDSRNSRGGGGRGRYSSRGRFGGRR